MLTPLLLSLSSMSPAPVPVAEPNSLSVPVSSTDVARKRASLKLGSSTDLSSTSAKTRLSSAANGNGSLHAPDMPLDLGGQLNSQSSGDGEVTAWPHPASDGVWELLIRDTGTWKERFLMQIPDVSPMVDVPLLVTFHAYSVSYFDIVNNTTFLEEAMSRGWYLVAPIGATDINFSSPDSVNNTELVMEFVVGHYNINPLKVYGVGFSMGGGNVTNYAARHLDPSKGMFAAVVNHTGTVSVNDTYESDQAVRWALEILHEGTPQQFPFNYEQASVMSLDPVTREVDMQTDLARNLVHIPMLSYRASNEPLAYLASQTQIFADHMNARGGSHWLYDVPGSSHSWDTIDEFAICSFFNFHELELPLSGNTLADRNGHYFYFDVKQDQPGAFTPFIWAINHDVNKFTLLNTRNLDEIRVDTQAAGLNTSGMIRIEMNTADGSPDTIILTGYTEPPMDVTLDGVSDASWEWDAAKQWIKIDSAETNFHVWAVTPR
jgi:pimeloyl-ACP methyl ester carboxylesterase